MPSRSDRNAFKAGLFICASIIAAVAIVVAIKGISRFVVPSQKRTVRFSLSDDIGGLGPGDDVRIGGAKVGVVRDIDIVPGDGSAASESFIDVSFTLPDRYILRKGTLVTVQSTLTGLSVLNIANLGHGDALAASAVITGQQSGLTSFLASAGKLGPELEAIVRNVKGTTIPRVNGLIEHVDNKIDPIVDQYKTVAGKGADMLTSINSLLGDTHSDLRATIASLTAIAATIREKLPAIMDQTHGLLDKVNVAITRTNEALVDVKTTVANARDISGSAREILLGNRGKIEEMIASLRITSENLKGASEEIRRSPWRLLYHPSPNEMANLNLYDSARQFADGANNLSDAATALRDQIKASPGDQKQVQALLKKLEDSYAHFNAVEQQLWSRVKE